MPDGALVDFQLRGRWHLAGENGKASGGKSFVGNMGRDVNIYKKCF